MNKLFLLLLVFAFTTQSFTDSKKDLKTRVEALLELSNSLTDDAKMEIKKIQDFLEPSENQEKTAIELYQAWHRELKTFGTQSKKIKKIVFLNKKQMAFVDIGVVRNVRKKNAKGKEITEKALFDLKTTWVKVNGKWCQRTKRYATE